MESEFVDQTGPACALGAEAIHELGRLQGEYVPGFKKLVFLSEKPWHNAVAQLEARGYRVGEIAAFTSKSTDEINEVRRQDWYKARVQEYVDKETEGLTSLFKQAAFSAFNTLVEIHEDKKAPASTRVSAADKILDRYLGKAVQHVDLKATRTSGNVVEENKALEEEIKQLSGQLKILPQPAA